MTGTVQDAEAAWLVALVGDDQQPLRELMHPDCRVVHGAVGRVDDPDQFLRAAKRVGRVVRVEAHELAIRRFGDLAIVTCLQESRTAFVPDLAPFTIQAAVTRVWSTTPEGWRLVHLQMARRMPPG